MSGSRGAGFAFGPGEWSGALGDAGTLLPLMLGAIALGGLAPGPVLLGFALSYIFTAVHYRLPIPVQPMKAVAAVLITAELAPGDVAAVGVMLGAILLVLGWTGWISRFGRLVPQSILAGLQLGLGVALAAMSLDLLASAPVVGGATLLVVVALLYRSGLPAALLGLALAAGLGSWFDAPGVDLGTMTSGLVAIPAMPSPADIDHAFTVAVLPQLALTFTNAVLLTALVAGDYFGERATHVTPARLSITTGAANLVLTPLGALPMCHGAGGLAAHHRFGARTGGAPLVLGFGLLALAVLPADAGVQMLAALPLAGLGALLLVAAGELAMGRRLLDSKPSCWPVIAMTAGVTVWVDPFWGLVAGSGGELVRMALFRMRRRAGA